MMKPAFTIYTVAEAAKKLEHHPSYLRRICAEHDDTETPIGIRKSERIRLLTEADIERLRGLVRKAGNPNFGPGFRPKLKKPQEKRRSKS